jgi:hypothetical protein
MEHLGQALRQCMYISLSSGAHANAEVCQHWARELTGLLFLEQSQGARTLGTSTCSARSDHRAASARGASVQVPGVTAEANATDSKSGAGTALRLRRLRRLSDTVTAAGAPDTARMVVTAAASLSATSEGDTSSRAELQPADLLAVLTGSTPMLQPVVASIEFDSARVLMASAAVAPASASTRRPPSQSRLSDRDEFEAPWYRDRIPLVQGNTSVLRAAETDPERLLNAFVEDVPSAATITGASPMRLPAHASIESDSARLLMTASAEVAPGQAACRRPPSFTRLTNHDDVHDRQEFGHGNRSVLRQEEPDHERMFLASVEDVPSASLVTGATPMLQPANASIASDSARLPMPPAGAVVPTPEATQQPPSPTRLEALWYRDKIPLVQGNTSAIRAAELDPERCYTLSLKMYHRRF